MSDDDDNANQLLFAMGQFNANHGVGSEKHYIPGQPYISPGRLNSGLSTSPVRTPRVVLDDPNAYQVSGFRGWKYAFGRQPENLVTEPEREVARRTFGSYSTQAILQTRRLPNGREAYLLPSWQVIQRSSPKEEAEHGGQITFHLRKRVMDPQTARMIVDGFESQPDSFVDFNKLPINVGRAPSPQSAIFKLVAKNALRQEENRRHTVVHGGMKAWEEKIMSDRVSRQKAGALPTDATADLASKARLELVNQINTALTSGKLSSQQMSQAYREFEPWGHSKPKTSEPDWAKLAVITGVRAAPHPGPSAGPSSPQPGPYKPRPRTRAA